MEFLNPAFLWFSLAASVPVIIHLLNRQRFIRLEWAAMDFLQQALKKIRRRVQLENLLVLLLRMLLILFFVLALSKPLLQNKALAGLLGEEPTQVVLLVDTTYSMAYRLSGAASSAGEKSCSAGDLEGTNFELAKKKALEILERYRGNKSNRVSLFTFAAQPQALVSDASSRFDDVEEKVKNLPLTFAPGDLEKTLLFLKKNLKTEPSLKEAIYFITDNQRINWEGTSKENQYAHDEAFQSLLKELSQGDYRFYLVALPVPSSVNNVALTDLQSKSPLIVPGQEAEFVVHIKNFSQQETAPAVELRVDNMKVDMKPPARPIPPMGEGEVVFSHTFPREGSYVIAALLPSDALAIDNCRYEALDIRRELNVLVVDGHPDLFQPASRDPVFYLTKIMRPLKENALSRGDEDLAVTFYKPQVQSAQEVTSPFYAYDLVILADVPQLSSEQLKSLKAYVETGGGLLIFLGPDVNREFYNGAFYDQGVGLMPASLKTILGKEKFRIVRFGDLLSAHPAMRLLSRYREELGRLQFHQYFDLALPGENKKGEASGSSGGGGGSGDGTNSGGALPGKNKKGGVPLKQEPSEKGLFSLRVLASYADAANTPWIVEKLTGSGKVILVNSTANQEWFDAPVSPVYFALIRQLVDYLVANPLNRLNLSVGDGIGIYLTRKNYSHNFEIVTPSQARIGEVPIALPHPADTYYLGYQGAQSQGLEEIGRYEVWRKDPQTESQEIFLKYAVNPSVEESNLQTLSPGEMEQLFPMFHFITYQGGTKKSPEDQGKAQKGRLARLSLGLVLAAAALESLLACLFGRKRV